MIRGQSIKIRTVTEGAALFFGCGLLAMSLIQRQEFQDQEVLGQGFTSYILKSQLETHAFLITDQHSLVPQIELYHPLPENIGFLSVPERLLVAVARYEKSCKKADLERADEVARELARSPSKLIAWHKAVCENNALDFHLWLGRAPFLHPGGSSYAKLYSERFSDQTATALNPLLHLRERKVLGGFEQWYLKLSVDDQVAFLRGFELLPLAQEELAVVTEWDGSARKIYIYSLNTLNAYLRRNQSVIVKTRYESPRCDILKESICLVKVPGAFPHWKSSWIVIISTCLALFIALFTTLNYLRHARRKRERDSDQALLFQVISHEIRTPMTAIKLNLDGLRQGFDRLENSSQKYLLQILESFYDLEKIVTRTLRELKGEDKFLAFEVNRAVETLCETKYGGLVTLIPFESPLMVNASEFWFEICLSNLIRNALNHGRSPITVEVSRDEKHALIEVRDQGDISLTQLNRFLKPFAKGDKSSGLGLGLTIVSRKMNEFGGSLGVLSSPTRFTLRFKLVEDQ